MKDIQDFVVNDYEEHTSNRQQTQSDTREARQWTGRYQDRGESSTHNANFGDQKQPNREGRVGQNPPKEK
ncbi:hypothetical protein Bca52824_035674 [Brassica carinata]|uniref:Uncharacterized protein n=1 Tax=Brassica carinata TaxID=52824 RepID=A0A8X7S3V6_BRACI|nr:hypothetical protein Bca52824_035674 [Brassica carinata]